MLIIWIVAFVILIIIEILTVNLVTIWFAIGALAAAITTFFTSNIFISTTVFIIVSILALLITKPIIKKFKINEIVPTNLDRVIGKIAIVTEDITRHEPGEVKIDGKRWTAYATKKILKNSKVEILAIDGVKLKVKEVKEDD